MLKYLDLPIVGKFVPFHPPRKNYQKADIFSRKIQVWIRVSSFE